MRNLLLHRVALEAACPAASVREGGSSRQAGATAATNRREPGPEAHGAGAGACAARRGWLGPRPPPAKAARAPASRSSLGRPALGSPPAASALCPPAVPGPLSATQVAAQCTVEAAKNPKAGLGPHGAHQPSSASLSRSGSPPTARPGPPGAPKPPPPFPAQSALHCGPWPGPGPPTGQPGGLFRAGTVLRPSSGCWPSAGSSQSPRYSWPGAGSPSGRRSPNLPL